MCQTFPCFPLGLNATRFWSFQPGFRGASRGVALRSGGRLLIQRTSSHARACGTHGTGSLWQLSSARGPLRVSSSLSASFEHFRQKTAGNCAFSESRMIGSSTSGVSMQQRGRPWGADAAAESGGWVDRRGLCGNPERLHYSNGASGEADG